MIKPSPPKIILCATASRLLAGIWVANQLQSYQIFMNEAAGHREFSKFLQQHSRKPIYLIADAVEEDYHLESFPHTTGTARRALISRKLKQLYGDLKYRTAQFIARAQDQRKDDQFLFAALNNDEFLQPWMTRIQSNESLLVGVYLLPMLSQLLVKKLKLTEAHIVLCEKLSSGLRQTYLRHGLVNMSRLVPNTPIEAGAWSYFYLSEIEKTRLYLMSQRFISRDTAIAFVSTSENAAPQDLSPMQGMTHSSIRLNVLAQSLNLATNLMQQMPELLHMQLLASEDVVANLAPPMLTQHYQLHQMRRLIYAMAAGIALVGVFVCTWFYQQGLAQEMRLKQVRHETAVLQQREKEVAKTLPASTASAATMKSMIALKANIATYPKSPQRAMQAVSAALEKVAKNSPEQDQSDLVKLNRLRWVLSSNLNLKDEATLANAVLKTKADALANTLYELCFMNVEVLSVDGLNAFIDALKGDGVVASVEVLQAPVNSTNAGIQGSTAELQNAQKSPLAFTLKLVLNPHAESIIR